MSKRDEENTAPEIPWEERSYLEGLWRFWPGHTKTTAINGRKVCHVYLVPADEARELLADRERLKRARKQIEIAFGALRRIGRVGTDISPFANYSFSEGEARSAIEEMLNIMTAEGKE